MNRSRSQRNNHDAELHRRSPPPSRRARASTRGPDRHTLPPTVLDVSPSSSLLQRSETVEEVKVHTKEHLSRWLEEDFNDLYQMVRVWTCKNVEIFEDRQWNSHGPADGTANQWHYEWTQVRALPKLWVKKTWHAPLGWQMLMGRAESEATLETITSAQKQPDDLTLHELRGIRKRSEST